MIAAMTDDSGVDVKILGRVGEIAMEYAALTAHIIKKISRSNRYVYGYYKTTCRAGG